MTEIGQFPQFSFTVFNLTLASVIQCGCLFADVFYQILTGEREKFTVFIQNYQIVHCKSELFNLSIESLAMLSINKQVNSTCCLLSFINLQLVIPG